MAQHLDECLQSLAGQDVPIAQIIVVDDGSTDNTKALLAYWQDQLPQMEVVFQQNQGVSAARNIGLTLARQRYVAFLDADDYPLSTMYSKLCQLAELQSLDIAISNAVFLNEDGKTQIIKQQLSSSEVMTGGEWLSNEISKRQMKHYVWWMIFGREFLSSSDVKFVSGILHEDIPWVTQILVCASRVAYTPEALYAYRQRPGSLSKPQTNDHNIKIIYSYICIVLLLDKFADQGNHVLTQNLEWQIADEGLGIFHRIDLPPPDRRDEMRLYLWQSGALRVIWKRAHYRQRRRAAKRIFLLAFRIVFLHK